MRIEFPRVQYPISDVDFYRDYILPNRPCILEDWITNGWIARQAWSSLDPGGISIQRLLSDAPSSKVCVADCSRLEFDTHPVIETNTEDYLTYWRDLHTQDTTEERLLYLKDWHYFRRPDNRSLYVLPKHFSSDWMNEFWSVRPDSEDDFRFVYLGPQGTWTPLHADVYRSFSWSANICGRKRWWFFPPGEEKRLQQTQPNNRLPVDIRQLDLDRLGIRHAVVDQFPGQAVFVPSGWYHEVLNLTDCVSINHNWFNAANASWIWEHLQEQLELVEKSTEDVRDTPGWHEQCQVCLRALTGMDFREFFILLKYILVTRWPDVRPWTPADPLPVPPGGELEAADSLSAFERELDAVFCQLLEKHPSPFARVVAAEPGGERSLKDVLLEQMDSMDLPPNQWLRSLDFHSAASVLRSFCRHPKVRQLQLIGSNLGQLLTAIKLTEAS